MYFISPHPDQVALALSAWNWIGIERKRPIRVTAFAGVFFEDNQGIWFLDTVRGRLSRIANNVRELDELLATNAGKKQYLFSDLADRLALDGIALASNECYDFIKNPVLGGSINYENIQKQDFAVTLNIAGQIHQQVRNLPPGTKINSISIDDARSVDTKKPWWKLW